MLYPMSIMSFSFAIDTWREDSTVAAFFACSGRRTVDILRNNVCEKGAKTFLDWSYLFTEQMNHIEETWMNPESCEEASKVLLTDAEVTPCVTLINDAAPLLAITQSFTIRELTK